MRKILATLIAYLAIAGTAGAQTATPTPVVFTQGYYEWENHISDMTYTGTWVTTTFSPSIIYRQSNAGATVALWVRGKYLLVYRAVDPAFYGGSNEVCIGATCSSFGAYHSAFAIVPFVVTLPDNSSNYEVEIESVSYPSYLDAFMVLDEPSLSLPTPTPITFPPSPTPINTPVNTATPAPTVTPLGIIWVIDPTCKYGSTESGEITCESKSATAGDISIFSVLAMLTLGMGGMFFLVLFGFVEGRRK